MSKTAALTLYNSSLIDHRCGEVFSRSCWHILNSQVTPDFVSILALFYFSFTSKPFPRRAADACFLLCQEIRPSVVHLVGAHGQGHCHGTQWPHPSDAECFVSFVSQVPTPSCPK